MSALNSNWEYVIGLEVHAQVKSNSKLFSSAPTSFGQSPNSCVSLFDAATPGTLPILNEFCVKQAIKTGLALNAQINLFSAFDRKNYFYPDLPHGYQISQFYHPIVSNGFLDIEAQGVSKRIKIERIHLEQDAGKSLHDQDPYKTFIDLNRAGIALMEIVTGPDLSSSEEAGQYLKKLRNILRYLGTCDGDMERGSLRCDANVSIRRYGENLGTRCEIKNLNSIKNIIRAIEFEGVRQIDILEKGGEIQQETRLFDTQSGQTFLMRSKENAMDYRYFPDPDLSPLILETSYVEEIKKEIPELPDAKKQRYIEEYSLSSYDAQVLSADRLVADYFEIVAKKSDHKLAANWIMGELFSYLNEHNLSIDTVNVKSNHLAELINLIRDKTISGKMAKIVFQEMCDSGHGPGSIIKEKNLGQISDPNELADIIDEVIRTEAKSVNEYLSGKTRLFGFLVGQIIKASGNKADPVLINKMLKDKLQENLRNL